MQRKNWLKILLSLMSIFLSSVASQQQQLDWQLIPGLNHEYAFGLIPKTWDASFNLCDEHGGHLWTIDDEKENEAVYYFMRHRINATNVFWWTSGYNLYSASINGASINWRWSSNGHSVQYLKWCPGNPLPSSSNNHCILFKNGCYQDEACYSTSSSPGTFHSYLCERPQRREWSE